MSLVKKIVAKFRQAADTLVGPPENEDPKKRDEDYWKEKKPKMDAAIAGNPIRNPKAEKEELKGREKAARTPVYRPEKSKKNDGYKKRGSYA